MIKDSYIESGAWLFIFLNILDCALTFAGIRYLGATEQNWLKVFAGNLWLLVAVKMFLVLAIVYYHDKFSGRGWIVLNIPVFGIVIWNSLIMLAYLGVCI